MLLGGSAVDEIAGLLSRGTEVVSGLWHVVYCMLLTGRGGWKELLCSVLSAFPMSESDRGFVRNPCMIF